MKFRSLRFADDAALAAAANNNPTICKGAKGPAVQAIQQALVDLGYPMPISMATPNATPDGIFGDETAQTVKTFQKEMQLDADGIVGRNTMRALDEVSAYEDLRPLRRAVDDFGSVVDQIARDPTAGKVLGRGHVEDLWSKTAHMKASLVVYQPAVTLPLARTGPFWLGNIPSRNDQEWASSGVATNPLGALLMLMMIAIFGVMRPMQVKKRRFSHSKPEESPESPSKPPATLSIPPATLLIPVVTAWELLTLVQAGTAAAYETLWKYYKGKYDAMRQCKLGKKDPDPACEEAWRVFEKVANSLIQKLNRLKGGAESVYRSLPEAARKQIAEFEKALAEVEKLLGKAP